MVKATITSRATVDSTGYDLPELMHCDTPRQLIGEIHTQVVGLQKANQSISELERENRVLRDQLKTIKKGVHKIRDNCKGLTHPPLRYKYHPQIFK